MRLTSSGMIDRSRAVEFQFDGRPFNGYGGDTLASALLANDVHLIARSFKYHRPRGIYSAGHEEPNAIVTVLRNGTANPNVRATTLEIHDDLRAISQNRWPSLTFDLASLNDLLSPLLPAGFYYKTFIKPSQFWPIYEHFIRHAAGMGRISKQPFPAVFSRYHDFCDVLVVGSGPAGLSAALAAGEAGASVLLAESDSLAGGALLRDEELIDGRSARAWLERSVRLLRAMPNVTILLRTTVFGYYDHNVLGAIEHVVDQGDPYGSALRRECLHVIRARKVILATGALERPIVFPGNDRPGVMLSNAVRTYLRRYAVCPGRRVVVFTNNDDAYETAIALRQAGADVACIIDSRVTPSSRVLDRAADAGVKCLPGHIVCATSGRLRIRRVAARPSAAPSCMHSRPQWFECDVLAISGGWTPTINLQSQSGAKPLFSDSCNAFVVGDSPQSTISVGSSAGDFLLTDCLVNGHLAGQAVTNALGYSACSTVPPQATTLNTVGATAPWVFPEGGSKSFVDLQDDVTADDVALAHREGYRSVEHLKRYTTLGMGTDQGKLSNLNGLAMMATLQSKTIAKTGATKFRPPFVPVSIGAFVGPEHGLHYRPIRRTALNGWHEAHGAVMVTAGSWLRPRAYPAGGETVEHAISREVRHVRSAVGLIDISTLGKLDLQGPQALEVLQRVYANDLHSLAIGRVRYAFMLREDGMLMDDGTICRLGEFHYVVTTTTANASKIQSHIEFVQQIDLPLTSVSINCITEQYAMMALAGPRSQQVLASATSKSHCSIDLIKHLDVAHLVIAGTKCRVSRNSYSGELAYEISTPATRALQVWTELMRAGQSFDILPYGTDAMTVMRIEKGHIAGPEIDGRNTARDLGLANLMCRSKHFVGKVLSDRPALVSQDRPALVGLIPLHSDRALRAGSQLTTKLRDSSSSYRGLGHITSACYSPTLNHYIALGLINGGLANRGTIVNAEFPLKGLSTAVRVVNPIFVDPEGTRFRD